MKQNRSLKRFSFVSSTCGELRKTVLPQTYSLSIASSSQIHVRSHPDSAVDYVQNTSNRATRSYKVRRVNTAGDGSSRGDITVSSCGISRLSGRPVINPLIHRLPFTREYESGADRGMRPREKRVQPRPIRSVAYHARLRVASSGFIIPRMGRLYKRRNKFPGFYTHLP